MAKEIQLAHNASGKALYALVRDAVGNVWKTTTSAFVAYASADLGDYDIALTEQGTASRYYAGDLPALAAGVYALAVYERAGVSPAEGDPLAATGDLHWDGSAIVPRGNLNSDAIAAAQLASSAITAMQSGLASAADLGNAQADLDDLQSRLPAALVSGRIDCSVGAMAADVVTAASLAAGAVTEIQTGLASAADLATLAGFVDTEVAAIKAQTDQLTFSSAGQVDAQVFGMQPDTLTASALAADAAQEIADALLDRTAGVETGFTLRQALRLILSACAAKLSGAGGATITLRDVNDAKDRITATVDAHGNRLAVTLDAT